MMSEMECLINIKYSIFVQNLCVSIARVGTWSVYRINRSNVLLLSALFRTQVRFASGLQQKNVIRYLMRYFSKCSKFHKELSFFFTPIIW